MRNSSVPTTRRQLNSDFYRKEIAKLFRLLFTLALLGALIWFWRRNRRPSARPTAAEPTSESMVRCAHCNTHVPRRQALQQDNHWYCSQAHQQQGPAARD